MRPPEQAEKDERLFYWADEEYMVGQQLVTQTGLYGPDLEEAVTIGSMAQDHLGYAYQLLKHLVSSEDRAIDRYVYERSPEEYHLGLLAQAWDPSDWALIVAKEYLYDSVCFVRAQDLKESDSMFSGLAEMMLRETDFRIRHWREWLRTLGNLSEGRERVNKALAFVLPMAQQSLTLRDGRGRWFESCVEELEAAGYAIPNPIGFPTVSGVLSTTRELLEDAHGYYRTHPEWVWG
ncbi:MAG: phenylacetate-CoA oxygenase subunit PaaI [Firmicutes bacterium]|nr:phenylacetate-CoA oxygenase subunit PaaI [Bacillota bacterium]